MLRSDGLYHTGTTIWMRFFSGGEMIPGKLPPNLTALQAAQQLYVGRGYVVKAQYTTEGERISLEIHYPHGLVVAQGSMNPELVLRFGKPEKKNDPKTIPFHPVPQELLEPSLEARAEQLRGRVQRGEVTKEQLEIALALGDPVAALAAAPHLDIVLAGQRLATLGPKNCVRVLLQLFWDQDDWFSNQQGRGTTCRKRDREGRALRALANWVLGRAKLEKVDKAYQSLDEEEQEYPMFTLIQAVAEEESAEVLAERMSDAIRYYADEHLPAAFEDFHRRVVPWILGEGDPLAEKLERVK